MKSKEKSKEEIVLIRYYNVLFYLVFKGGIDDFNRQCLVNRINTGESIRMKQIQKWCMYGAGFAAIVFGILFFFPIKNPILFIVINGICYLGASGFQVLIWAMVNDAIDYQELTTGDRKEGMVYATYSFFRKLASAVSSSLSSFTLALIGYNVNEAVQTAAVKAHIWKSYTAIYAIGYLIAVLILYFVYPLSKKKTEEMLETLAKKRAKQGE